MVAPLGWFRVYGLGFLDPPKLYTLNTARLNPGSTTLMVVPLVAH